MYHPLRLIRAFVVDLKALTENIKYVSPQRYVMSEIIFAGLRYLVDNFKYVFM